MTALRKPRLDIQIQSRLSRRWKGIVWHHSASPDRATRDWDGIVKYHTSFRVDYRVVANEEFDRLLRERKGQRFERPWSAVGYHGGTEWVEGRVVFHWGRPLDRIGAHAGVKGLSNLFNQEYLGLAAIGNFDLAPPKPEHWDFNLHLTRAFMDAFGISKSRVIGHREVFDKLGVPRQKSCPGLRWDMDLFRSDL
ncbi:MAG: N-acetylmuramoyl-L-alanine amidase [Elusimicrobia bacterium]|nr:N-acetylmuramoyl-L-alanine amidase [Elusimicrobiota bacterium]